MRQIVFDTETTGMNQDGGSVIGDHRIIEMGCVELIDRMPTKNYYHVYYNPDREVDEGAFKVHGIGNEFLADKPSFKDQLEGFEAYLEGADELIAHNISFDRQFVDAELKIAGRKYKLSDKFTLVDSLQIARERFPGARNNLDVLCKRFGVDNSNRELHGALLDAELLAEVYLKLTGGQSDLALRREDAHSAANNVQQAKKIYQWVAATVPEAEEKAHLEMMQAIQPKEGEANAH